MFSLCYFFFFYFSALEDHVHCLWLPGFLIRDSSSALGYFPLARFKTFVLIFVFFFFFIISFIMKALDMIFLSLSLSCSLSGGTRV
jgi:hypothetical protein